MNSMEGFSYYYVESGRLLNEAMESINQYIPKSAAELFFEANESDIASNQNAKKSENILIRAIKAVKNMISTLIKKISDFIQTKFMSKEEKERFRRFKELAAQDPNLKNKKISVKDFKKINKQYQKTLNDIDKSIAEVDRQTDEQAAETVRQIQELANNVVQGIKQGATAVFSVDTALRLAENNRTVAQWIQKKLQEENGAIENLERQIGKERTKDFQKKINSSTKKVSLHRIKVWFLGQYHGTMSGALNQTIDDFKDLLNPDMSVSSNVKRAKQARIMDDAVGAFNTKTGANETKTSLLKRGLKVRKEVNNVKNSFRKGVKEGEKRMAKAKEQRQKEKSKRKEKMKDVKNFILS